MARFYGVEHRLRRKEIAIADAAKNPAEESDDALMARVATRDGDALRLVADRHATRIFHIGCRMLRDEAEAEDIAQEALLRLWSHANRWRDGSSGIAAWLTRVATNLCLDRLRRRRRSSDSEVPDVADDTPAADCRIEGAETAQAVADCVAALPDRQRAAVVLTYYEDLPNRGASDHLDMQIKAFESLLHRAREALRQCVERKGVMHSDAAGMVR